MVVAGTGLYGLTLPLGLCVRADLTALIYLARNRGAKQQGRQMANDEKIEPTGMERPAPKHPPELRRRQHHLRSRMTETRAQNPTEGPKSGAVKGQIPTLWRLGNKWPLRRF